MRRKNARLISSLVAALTLLAGCSAGGGTDAGSAVPNSTTEKKPSGAAAVNQPVELTVYSAGGTNREEFERNFASYITKKFPHVTLKYINPRDGEGSKFENLIVAGTNIDLYYESIGTFFSTLPRNNAAFDLSDMIKQHNLDLSTFEPTLIDALKENGKGQIWGLPVTTNGMSLYYNKDIFDKFNVPYLKDGMTWDELYETANKLNRSDGGKQYVGLSISPMHSTRMNPFSVPFVDPKTLKSTFDNEQWRQILQPILAPAAESSYRAKITELKNKLPYSGEWLKTQEVAIFGVFSDWQVVGADPVPFNWDLAAYPTYKERPGIGSQQYPVYWAIPSFSKHKEQAFEVLKYLVSEDYQMELSKRGGMTVLKNPEIQKAFGQNSRYKDKNLASAYYNKFAPITPKTEYEKQAENALSSKFVDLAMGKIDLNTALRTAKEEADKAIEAAAKK